MSTITMPKKELKILIKETVDEVMTQKFMELRSVLLPAVSRQEQKDIEKLYGKPARKSVKSVEVRI